MKTHACGHCGQRVFFENVACGTCGSVLGFVPDELRFAAFRIEDDGSWKRLGPPGPARKPCANYGPDQVCNWMLSADSDQTLCVSCRTTHVIPALGKPGNLASWRVLERAKRRLFYSLIALGLPVLSKAEDPVHGVSFQFLEETSPKQKVLTGHDDGVITLNIAEADDAQRERMRTQMHEPYRTLLGHFRHEIGHYFWDRLVNDTAWLEPFRERFGDERADYGEALTRHYAQTLVDWPERFVSAYASAHPWEDWAECWAHYLHIVDGLETAASWGLRLDNAVPRGKPVIARALDLKAPTVRDALIERWLPVAQFVNAMDRSLGTHDSYPFLIPAPVVGKLEFIHGVVRAAAAGEAPMNFSPAPKAGETAASG